MGVLGFAEALDELDGSGAIDICATVSKAQAQVLRKNYTWGPIRAMCLFRRFLVREEDNVDFALHQCFGLEGSLVRLYGCVEVYLLVVPVYLVDQ